jgi:hypothetical protein
MEIKCIYETEGDVQYQFDIGEVCMFIYDNTPLKITDRFCIFMDFSEVGREKGFVPRYVVTNFNGSRDIVSEEDLGKI